jgi:hypothetical protein
LSGLREVKEQRISLIADCREMSREGLLPAMENFFVRSIDTHAGPVGWEGGWFESGCGFFQKFL